MARALAEAVASAKAHLKRRGSRIPFVAPAGRLRAALHASYASGARPLAAQLKAVLADCRAAA